MYRSPEDNLANNLLRQAAVAIGVRPRTNKVWGRYNNNLTTNFQKQTNDEYAAISAVVLSMLPIHT